MSAVLSAVRMASGESINASYVVGNNHILWKRVNNVYVCIGKSDI